jgi:drug/metabolite transporter (DMT)-like permease
MTLQGHLIVLVLLAAAAHAVWNAVVKVSGDRLLTFATISGTGMAIGIVAAPFVPLPAAEAWPFLLASTLIHCVYYATLLAAYRGDYSIVYPVARGSAPVMVAVLAAAFAGESLSAGGMVGIALASVGIVAASLWGGRRPGTSAMPLLWAGLTGLAIAAYTVADGMGVRRSGTAVGYVLWLSILMALPIVGAALLARRGRVAEHLKRNWRPGIGGGFLATLAYGLAIYAMSQGAMAQVAVLRETSVVMAAAIGAVTLREGFGLRRVLAAATIVAGIVLLHVTG